MAAVVVAPASVVGQSSGNEAPLADAGLDQHVEQGTTVLLDATGSRDPDGEIASYGWRVETPGGTTITPRCPTCGRTRFRPMETGTYAVTVTVTDDDGADSTDTLYVYVGDSEATDPASTPTPAPATETTPEPGVPAERSDSDTGNPPGIDPGASGSCAAGTCSGGSGPEPWVTIDGPTETEPGEPTRFDLEYGGFDGEPQFGWSVGISGTGGETSWTSPGSETIYVTGVSESRTAHASHDVRITENQPPVIDINTPDQIHPGETITLTAEVSDPDGWIVSREWVNGPTVEVPNRGSRDVSVIAEDNDGRVSVINLNIKSEGIESDPEIESGAKHTVYCYYDKEYERQNQLPDHCEIAGSDNSGDDDGYQTGTSDLDRMLRLPHYNVVWKKTEEEITQHSGDISDETGITMPDVRDNDGDRLTLPSLSNAQLDAIAGRAATTDSQSFSMNGKRVENDLNGDGEVNAEDWDERYGTTEQDALERHPSAVSEFEESQRAVRRAQSGGGSPTPTNSRNGNDGQDAGSDTDDHSSSSGSGGGGIDYTGGLTSSGERAAEQGRRIANGGYRPGGGMY
ncbi:PKD domain-containing protein [Halorarius halobius]|uniref:PKD domain-containing protein n=1 Tax=Halorarius halobius TaxID=2962671 RepID=UPI0020CC1F0C|nr:PKD domain-containing protein [Halorarius halobius]